MRILALTPTYYPFMGGAERTVHELYTRLEKKGYTIDLVTPHLGGKKKEKIGTFTIYRVGKQVKSKYLKFICYQWHQYRQAKKLAKKHKYDFIHMDFGFPACFAALKLKKEFNLPLVTMEFHMGTGMDIIRPEQNPRYVPPILRKVYQASTVLLAISNEQKDFVDGIAGRNDTVVIHQGTDHEWFKPSNHNEQLKKKFDCKGPVFLTVSRLSKRKCIDDMIRAVQLVTKKYPTAKLLIVGKGEEKEHLEQLIKKLKLEKNVQFTGFVSDEDLRDLYATADIFLLTSKYEGFGIANCEALASGTPVITYDTTAASDYIKDYETGFVTKHSPKILSQKILYLLDRPEKLQEMSKEARRLIEGKYTWNRYADDYDRIFKEHFKEKMYTILSSTRQRISTTSIITEKGKKYFMKQYDEGYDGGMVRTEYEKAVKVHNILKAIPSVRTPRPIGYDQEERTITFEHLQGFKEFKKFFFCNQNLFKHNDKTTKDALKRIAKALGIVHEQLQEAQATTYTLPRYKKEDQVIILGDVCNSNILMKGKTIYVADLTPSPSIFPQTKTAYLKTHGYFDVIHLVYAYKLPPLIYKPFYRRKLERFEEAIIKAYHQNRKGLTFNKALYKATKKYYLEHYLASMKENKLTGLIWEMIIKKELNRL